LQDQRNVLLVATNDHRPAAFAFGHVLDRLDGDRMLFVYDVGTAETLRRRGAGSAAMRRLLEVAGERGCAKVFVVTRRSNRAAMALYAGLGGVTQNLPDGDDVVVWWRRSPS
jgi:ribosomal protein S18 acetylase RimI-like enzyme